MSKKTILQKIRKTSPVRIIVFGFIIVIMLGTLLLSLPISYAGEKISVLDTVFTVTSATCVTGLVVTDTAQHWTAFGETVILFLIQIGGLGFMAILTFISFVARRKISLKERVVLSESLSGIEVGGIIRLVRKVLIWTICFETVGAILLSFVFIPDFGITAGIWKSVFISVSAFCNAGFDVMGDKYGAFSSLVPYANNILVNLTVCSLIILGGLGFVVWGRPKQKHFSLHVKIVFLMTAILILGGTALFYLFEHNNPQTLGNMHIGEKILASFFQSVTTRTAGFNTISNDVLTIPSKLLTMLLMFIGGSPASTAGGIKTVTVALVFWGTISIMRGRSDVNFFRRRISKTIVVRAMAVTFLALMIACVSSLILLCLGGGTPIALVFEVFSALGTVGLGTGITPFLPAISKVLLIILMFTGRVGIMTLALAVLLKEEKINNLRYPKENVLLG